MKKEYSEEFRMDAVRLAQSGDVSAAQVAREQGVNHHTLYNWIEKYGVKHEGPDGAVVPCKNSVHAVFEPWSWSWGSLRKSTGLCAGRNWRFLG